MQTQTKKITTRTRYVYSVKMGTVYHELTNNALAKLSPTYTWLSSRDVFNDLYNLHQYAACQISPQLLQYEVMEGFDKTPFIRTKYLLV